MKSKKTKTSRIDNIRKIREMAKDNRDQLAIESNKKISDIASLSKQIKALDKHLYEIEAEHDSYRFDGEADQVAAWFQSFPIESLNDSLKYDRDNKLTKYSLLDLSKKSVLRKEHEKTIEQFESLQNKLRIAKIELLQLYIRSVDLSNN